MTEVIQFVGLQVGGLRLRSDLVTKARLEFLFQLQGTAVLLDEDGEEINPNPDDTYPNLQAGRRYTVVCEDDIENESFEERLSKMTEEEYRMAHQKILQRAFAMQDARIQLIREVYKPLHPQLYNIETLDWDKIIDPRLKKVIETIKDLKKIPENEVNIAHVTSLGRIPEALLQLGSDYFHIEKLNTSLFSLPWFLPEFCDEFLEEIDNFEQSGLPVNRPNSMNNYGVILEEIGLGPLVDYIRENYISPLAEWLFPKAGGDSLDGIHGFIVQYKMTEDLELGFHYDDAEVTLNVCLGREFTGGGLYFKGHLFDKDTQDEHLLIGHHKGKALLHIGKHRHGASPITSGERYNLIVWCRSSSYRQSNMSCCGCGHKHDHDGHDSHDEEVRDEGDEVVVEAILDHEEAIQDPL